MGVFPQRTRLLEGVAGLVQGMLGWVVADVVGSGDVGSWEGPRLAMTGAAASQARKADKK